MRQKRKMAIAVCWLSLLMGVGCQVSAPARLRQAAGPQAPGPQATVTRVVSGQTVEATLDAQTLTLRLAGLTAPDYRQIPWSSEAQQALETLVLQQSVTLEPVGEPDKYGRQWAYVWAGDRLINEQLVAEGHALTEPSDAPRVNYDQRLAHAQHRARLLGLGLWNPDYPMRQTPVEFRQQLPAAP